MAGDWRGYRPLIIAGRPFRWACAFADPWAVWHDTAEERCLRSPDRVLVRPEDSPSRLLTIWWPVREGPVITPGLMRAYVEEAMRRGWPDALAALEFAGHEVPSPEQRHAEPRDAADGGA